jgi:Gnt-I system low-affinity gluconate transporter
MAIETFYSLLPILGSIAILLVLILGFRVHAFLALLIASVSVGLFSGMPAPQIAASIEAGMGKSLAFIAAVIGLGAILGKILEASGGAETIGRTLLARFGEKRAAWAMMLAGFLISIPVFLDVALVIMVPILYSLTRKTGKSLLFYGIPLLAGMAVSHACVPPTPGPIAVASFLNAPLGLVALYGVITGLPAAIVAGPMFGAWVSRRLHLPVPEFMEVEAAPTDESKLPSFGLILGSLLLPLALMLVGSLVKAEFVPTGPVPATLPGWVNVTIFLGHPIIALLIATVFVWIVLGLARGFSANELMDLSSKALGPAGLIILITGAGGVFKEMLGQTEVAQNLAQTLKADTTKLLLIAYGLAAVVRLIQGSATIAMVTAGALIAQIIESSPTPPSNSELALTTLAIAFGATIYSHVNDSGFWLVSRFFGMDVKQTLKSWSVMELIVSVAGLAAVLALSMIV